MADPIVHVEIPVNDLPKLRKFYSEVFGWKFRNSKMPGMEYPANRYGLQTGRWRNVQED
ncbi:MAG: hypothetical protein FJ358_01370 [Thaumarchaeota archaeon]|nr:hypothetical protein [Nitrososphaerota archaeon]